LLGIDPTEIVWAGDEREAPAPPPATEAVNPGGPVDLQIDIESLIESRAPAQGPAEVPQTEGAWAEPVASASELAEAGTDRPASLDARLGALLVPAGLVVIAVAAVFAAFWAPVPTTSDSSPADPPAAMLRGADLAPGPADYAPPVPLVRVMPVYPASLDGRPVEEVVLRILVDKSGYAARILLFEGQGDSPVVNAAIEAALRSRYRPATLRGEAVAAWTTESYLFQP
jgi:hypothetical protein